MGFFLFYKLMNQRQEVHGILIKANPHPTINFQQFNNNLSFWTFSVVYIIAIPKSKFRLRKFQFLNLLLKSFFPLHPKKEHDVIYLFLQPPSKRKFYFVASPHFSLIFGPLHFLKLFYISHLFPINSLDMTKGSLIPPIPFYRIINL